MSDTASTGQQTVGRPLQILLAVVVVAGIAYFAFTALTGDEVTEVPPGVGPSSEVPTSPEDAGVAVADPADPAADPTASGDPDAPPVVDSDPLLDEDVADEGGEAPTFEVFNARDPFEQLVAEATTNPVGGAPDGTVPGSTPTAAVPPPPGAAAPDTPGAPGTPPAATGTPTSSPGSGEPSGSGSPSGTTVGGTTIVLEEVFSDGGVQTALLTVNGQGYEAVEGETVADSVTVVDIAGSCATLRFSDARFILCEGEQIRK